jgi:hypothetical protein
MSAQDDSEEAFREDGSTLLYRPCTRAFEAKSIPQENPWFEVPRAFLEAASDGFRGHVHNACAKLGFNLDEIGVSEWDNCSERRFIVPSTMREQTTYHVVHRNLKHRSVVACISAAGEHMTLFWFARRGMPPWRESLKLKGSE